MLRRRTRVRFVSASASVLKRANHQATSFCMRVRRQAPHGVRNSHAQARAIRRAHVAPAQVLRFIFTKG
jgi:hypothetical protein